MTNSEAFNSLYLDDLVVGQRFTSGEYYLDEAQIKTFASEFDPQPFHLNKDLAQDSFFQGLAASGWHTAAITMRLLVTGQLRLASGFVGMSAEVTWSKAVRPGDTLRVESEIIHLVESRSKPDRGTVTLRCTTLNKNGDQVQLLIAKVLVFKRSANFAFQV